MRKFGLDKLPYKKMIVIIATVTIFIGVMNSMANRKTWFSYYDFRVVFVYSAMISFFCFWFSYGIDDSSYFHRKILFFSSIYLRVFAGTTLGLIIANVILFGEPVTNESGMFVAYLATSIITLVITSYEILRARLEEKITRLKEVELENERLKRFELEARFNSLQAKLNPHFLFNTLNSTAALVYEDRKKAEKNIIRLSELYRKVLSISNKTFITVEEEIELIEDYLELEKMRFDKSLTYEINCSPDIRIIKIPGLIIEPLVENSIKHNLGRQHQPLHIEIKIRMENSRLYITVTDNGYGFDVEKAGNGFGIYSIQERLKLIYENEYRLNISSGEKKGTIVEIDIPIEDKKL